jgi:hypothetical protein
VDQRFVLGTVHRKRRKWNNMVEGRNFEIERDQERF